MSDITQYDEKSVYCRRLGGNVPFSYCRLVNNKLPCPTTVACWEMKFDVGEFIKKFYTESEIREFLYHKVNRMDRILTVLDDVKKRK